MRELINFTVRKEGEDLRPPKKRGKKSMWRHRTEVPRLIKLRKAASEEMKARRHEKPFAVKLRLTLCVHIGSKREGSSGNKGSGDLDNFITGVCDGLMAAHERVLEQRKWHEDFCRQENQDVHPERAIAFEDDRNIMEICAKKVFDSALGDACWYQVKLEEWTRLNDDCR